MVIFCNGYSVINSCYKSNKGGSTTISHNYPSMSDKFTKIIFKKRDLPRSTGDVVGWLWTKK